MLVLARHPGEAIRITLESGEQCEVKVLLVKNHSHRRGPQVHLGLKFPQSVKIARLNDAGIEERHE